MAASGRRAQPGRSIRWPFLRLVDVEMVESRGRVGNQARRRRIAATHRSGVDKRGEID